MFTPSTSNPHTQVMKNCDPTHQRPFSLLCSSTQCPRLTIGVWPRVGHGQDSCSDKSQIWVNLICKLVPIYTRSSTSSSRWISTLDHEAWYYTVKDDAVIVSPLGEFRKVVTCLMVSSYTRGAYSRIRTTFGACALYSSTVKDPTDVSNVT
jgi:hypothetical protein